MLGDTECYNNVRSLQFSAVNSLGNAVEAGDWSASIFYGGKPIDGISMANGTITFENEHIRSGDYQVFVYATYNGKTSSSTFDFKVLDCAKFEMDLGDYEDDAEFEAALVDVLQEMWSDVLFVFTGNGSANHIQKIFRITLTQNSDYLYSVTADMSAVQGITTLETGQITINEAKENFCTCLQKIILPDSITTIEDRAITSNSYQVSGSITVGIGANVREISYPASLDYSPFNNFEVNPDNQYFATNNSGTLLLSKNGDTIVWGANAYDLVIPDSVKNIGKGAFHGCTRLEYHEADYSTAAISMNKVEIIYENAFSKTQSSAGYALTKTVQAVGANAFDSSAPVTDDDVSEDQKWNWHYTTDRDTWLNNDSTGEWTDLEGNSTGYFRSAVSNGNYLRRK